VIYVFPFERKLGFFVKKKTIIVREIYKEYKPPFNVTKTVDHLLCGIPQNYLAGLKTVVVTNSGNLSKPVQFSKVRTKGRSYKLGSCRGLYHQKEKGQPAWIELFVDNIFFSWPKGLLGLSPFRDFAISKILFHEIGHHLHYVRRPEYKEREDVATKWEKKLNRYYFRHQYWYLIPFAFLLWITLKPFRKKGKAKHLLASNENRR